MADASAKRTHRILGGLIVGLIAGVLTLLIGDVGRMAPPDVEGEDVTLVT
ncbi:MAG: hypothetical protein K0R17_3484 [Rariglobus sp.]|jgi:hypothetical protein|nr:hypothetical protein [Rariglobus sp.]